METGWPGTDTHGYTDGGCRVDKGRGLMVNDDQDFRGGNGGQLLWNAQGMGRWVTMSHKFAYTSQALVEVQGCFV